MKKNFVIFLGIAFLLIQACKQGKTSKTTTSATPEIVATIGEQPLSSSEFRYVYNKNNSNSPEAYTNQSVRDYLKLYINFKLKVKEAEELGLDTAKSFKKELDGYRKQLSQPYFTEKSVTDALTKEAYQRMQEEINAAHILIKVSLEADPKDTLVAYNKINDLRQKAINGESFEKLASESSEDPSAKTNKGNLGYFTAFGTIYPFETAAYNTQVGSISQPVRTQFGYHIIKVKNRRKSQGQVKVAHIMIRASEGIPTPDSIAAKEKIDEIYKMLKAGEDWNKLVTQFSEDASSKNKNGELSPFTAGKMIPSFEEAAFALQTPNEYSAPIQTPYGWHIIKLLERKPLESFETLEPTIKQKVAKDRGEMNKKALLERLRTENAFVENKKAVESTIALADSTLIKGNWSKQADEKNNPVLFTIKQDKYTQKDFFAFLKVRAKAKKNISPEHYMRNLYKEYSEESLIRWEESHLEEKHEDYRMLIKEYRDGILLFQLMDEKVWSKAIEDTAGLKKYFNSHRDKFKWDTRVQAQIFSLSNKESLPKLKENLTQKKFAVKDYQVKEVAFAQGKNDLTDGDKAKLDIVASEINKNKSYIAEIKSGADFNEGAAIASKRASAIIGYLRERGIDSTKILVSPKIGIKASKDKVADRKSIITMYSTSAKELEKYFNANAPLALQVSEGLYQVGEKEELKNIELKEGEYTFEKDGRTIYVVVSRVEEPRLKQFEEARGLIISDYQSYLEQEWISALRKKYPVTENEVEIQKIIKK